VKSRLLNLFGGRLTSPFHRPTFELFDTVKGPAMIARNIAATAMFLSLAMPALAESIRARTDSAAASFRVARLLTNLDHPWSMSWLPNGDALMATRPGDLLRWRPDGKSPIEIQNVPGVAAFGQGGLFDVKPAPDFAKSKRIVFAYAYLGVGEAVTRVAEAKLNDNSLSQVKVLFEAGPRSGSASPRRPTSVRP
jgi:glucose/arabinose dehydrogenase